jgi:ABC-type Fe3+/spermidine/putrescine transport system ATPase subunit
MMGISHLLQRKTTVLSGGELQRIALARVLASKPTILLLDEPLSAIDTPMKADLRGLLHSLNNDGMPILHVTHDFEEAVALGNYISIIDNGQIIQSGIAEEVISNPKTSFSANFSGERNFFKGYISSGLAYVHDENKVIVPIKLAHPVNHDQASILIRSNSVTLSLHEPDSSNLNNFEGTISKINPQKDGFQVCINIGISLFANITSESFIKMQLSEGLNIWVSFKASSVEVII